MPRKAKDEDIINDTKPKKTSTKKASTSTTKKTDSTKKSSSKTTKSVASKNSSTKATKKSTVSKKTTAKRTTVKSTKKVSTSKPKKVEILEYYDLPYRYNKTIVKVLVQTPTTLFVYWDISDEDKQKYIDEYGEFFFNDTKPVLIIHNRTMNYSSEIDINDFANSWYIHVSDANCDYEVELGRRPINEYAKITDYLYTTSSNDIIAPNDHILFDTDMKNVYFRNVKTNITTKKDISLSFLTRIGKIYNVKEFYLNLYKDENIDFDKLNFRNLPSS